MKEGEVAMSSCTRMQTNRGRLSKQENQMEEEEGINIDEHGFILIQLEDIDEHGFIPIQLEVVAEDVQVVCRILISLLFYISVMLCIFLFFHGVFWRVYGRNLFQNVACNLGLILIEVVEYFIKGYGLQTRFL